MNEYLLLTGIIITICILANRFTDKLPVPSLLVFIAMGMCFGVNGIFKIPFDNYRASETICSTSLVFIMFYGGFGTNLEEARSVAVKSILLSSLGVVLTAGFTGTFVHLFLKSGWLESLLIGSVIASTDAASVFNILRSKKLDLKYHTASLLELESGSNDPVSYMLTVILVAMLTGKELSVPLMLFKQVAFGLVCGYLSGKAAVRIANTVTFDISQGETIFVFASAILAYAFPTVIGGNGYLSVYICGIIMGNSYIPEKRSLVHFFDVLTGVAQMMIFFLLGLLVTPAQLPAVCIPALCIMVFLTFIGRPAAVSILLLPFRSSIRQIGIVSWAGLRGVASIVFAIHAVLNNVVMKYNLFNLVFCIVLMSIATQGALLPWISKKLRMIDKSADVRKTFNDYQEESKVNFVKIHIVENHPWTHQLLKDVILPAEFLIVLIIRGKEKIVPNGNTEFLPGDMLVVAAKEFEDRENLILHETIVGKKHKWKNKALKCISVPVGTLVVMIDRAGKTIIPDGDTVICEGDTLVIAKF
ncbi:potassium/proton antiporter [Lachnospiraceae bacterium 62-35]